MLSFFLKSRQWFVLTVMALAGMATGSVLHTFLTASRPGDIDVKPDDNRFTKVILAEKLDEPMEMTFLPGGKVLVVERKGGVRLYDPVVDSMKTIATIPVNIFYVNKKGQKRPAEEGLMGVVADPDFVKNHWIYMYYADPAEPKHILARWELVDDQLVATSKKNILEIPTQREECCHTGGGMVFDGQGNLFLTVGNNTVNPNSGTSNLDDRPGNENSDDQRTAGNTNDLRGKILRIHPNADGSYSIPKGNLFPPGTAKTRPEIYTMGHRNPWRPSLDSKTGFLYWGEVGPDASNDTDFGPKGYDEFNQAKGPGNFGWPYFIGDNLAYHAYDYDAKKAGPAFDDRKPLNLSRNNTGLTELPLPQKAMIWYPYGLSDSFPMLGASGRSATGGPVFRRSDFPNATRAFPAYYEGKWLITDFMRGWIMSVTLDEQGNYAGMERFLPKLDFGSAIDIDFSPDGDLYVIEYGTAWFRGNDNARLVRVEYNAGNRKPSVQISADKTRGALPMKVKLSSAGTIDYDNDSLMYEWTITGPSTQRKIRQAHPAITLDKAGTYKVTLTATDGQGAQTSQRMELIAGNDVPAVKMNLPGQNRTFYFPGDTLKYAVQVADKEDGSTANGRINSSQVAVTIDYLPIGYDQVVSSQSHRTADMGAFTGTGQILINQNDCKSCHQPDKKSVGPSYVQIAQKYRGKAGMADKLATKIIQGGTGVWGEHAMSAHPQISRTDARYMSEYILAINDKKVVKSLPLKGSRAVDASRTPGTNGSFVLRAAYRDRGAGNISPAIGEETLILRPPTLDPEKADLHQGAHYLSTLFKATLMEGDGAYLGYRNIDLTGIRLILINVNVSARNSATGGWVELRLDDPNGPVLSQSGNTETSEKRQNLQLKTGGVTGTHTLYFVFRNPKALASQPVAQVNNIEFKK